MIYLHSHISYLEAYSNDPIIGKGHGHYNEPGSTYGAYTEFFMIVKITLPYQASQAARWLAS